MQFADTVPAAAGGLVRWIPDNTRPTAATLRRIATMAKPPNIRH
jgi:hypothetical protein